MRDAIYSVQHRNNQTKEKNIRRLKNKKNIFYFEKSGRPTGLSYYVLSLKTITKINKTGFNTNRMSRRVTWRDIYIYITLDQ